MNKKTIGLTVVLLLGLSFVTSCSSSNNNASVAVENYYHALTSKDYNLLINNSCSDWELFAKTDYESFAAITASLSEINCQISSKENKFTLVSCSGKIIANYGNEVLEIDLADQMYLTIEEGGDWRMCGYR